VRRKQFELILTKNPQVHSKVKTKPNPNANSNHNANPIPNPNYVPLRYVNYKSYVLLRQEQLRHYRP